jgi:MscS family membrane protein
MSKAFAVTVAYVLVLVSLFGQAAPRLSAQDKANEKYRSPRDTVRTLLTAISLARAQPQRIRDAAACLDLSGLPAHQQDSAGLRATELEAVLRASDVDTNLLPDNISDTTYVFPDVPGQKIAMQRLPDGRWLFDKATVAQIPKLYAETQKQRQEKNREAAALKVPPEYASARATLRTFIDAYRQQDFARILGSLDLSDIPNVARQEVGMQLANKLKQIWTRHRLPILQEIPDSNYSDPYVWLSQPEGVVEMVRLPSGERTGEWVFSRATVRSIDKLFVAFEDKPYVPELLALGNTNHLPQPWSETEVWLRSLMPSWLRAGIFSTRHTTIQLYELLGYVIVPALAFLVSRLTTWLLTAGWHWFLHRRGWVLPSDVLWTRLRPTGRFVGVAFLRWVLLVIGPDRTLLVPALVVLNPLVWLLGIWAIYRLIDLVSDVMEAHLIAERRRPELTHMLWPVGSLAVKIALLVVTVFHLMALFAWDFTAVLTGLGIGGLAFALGAQDALKNFFGSFTLIADRPFVVGESVKIGDQEPGVVEAVGLRSTRVRTMDDTLLIVPNSNLTTMNITNFGRRRYRRYQTRLGIAYQTTPEQLAAFRDGIKEIIQRHPGTRKDYFEVAIIELAASAIEVLMNVYFTAATRQEELSARDELIMDVLRLAAALHIELAYPTQTIHVVPPTEEPLRAAAAQTGAIKRAANDGMPSM